VVLAPRISASVKRQYQTDATVADLPLANLPLHERAERADATLEPQHRSRVVAVEQIDRSEIGIKIELLHHLRCGLERMMNERRFDPSAACMTHQRFVHAVAAEMQSVASLAISSACNDR
jgi:hypothetical protein